MIVELDLPYPPSANRLWRTSRGRTHKSTEYSNWLIEAGMRVNVQRPGMILGPYKISIQAVRPDKRRRDLGNLEKPISDLLQTAGVIEDDSKAEKISLEWVDVGSPIRVRIEPVRHD